MADIKKELVDMLNQALQLEHAARIQYLAHAEKVSGPGSEMVINRLKEIASDELEHEEKFREMIGAYLGGVPTMSLAETHDAKDRTDILNVNLEDEKHAIDFYKQVYKKVLENRDDLQYEFETLEHELRHVIIDEQEHVSELTTLLGD